MRGERCCHFRGGREIVCWGGSLAVENLEILCVLGWVCNGLGFTLRFNNDFLSCLSSSSSFLMLGYSRGTDCWSVKFPRGRFI